MSSTKSFIYALSTLSATIIGVGFFSLPYIASKVGIWVMLGYFLILGSLVILVHLFFGELALKTPDYKRLPGFARIHLGKGAEKVAIISTILGSFGAILAYLIVGGEFLTNLLAPYFGGSSFLYSLIYFFIGAGLIYFGIKTIAKIEFWGLILLLLVLFAIFFRSHFLINLGNLKVSTDWSSLFLPYGAVLFSLWGASLIPEAEEMLGGDKRLIKKLIVSAILIPIFVYLFFIYFVLGITGPKTSESALPGLREFLTGAIINLAFLFGLIATFTSFIALGLTLRNVFWYDLKIGKKLAWFIACFFPLFLFLAGLKNFIPVISFVGGVMLGIDGILILLMYQKIRPERKLLVYPLILIFLVGIIYEIVYFIK